MFKKTVKWVKVAESLAEITRRGERSLLEVKVAGRELCLVFSNEKLFCINARCPHAGGRFCQGFTDNQDNIVCPLHRYKFKLANGINASGEGYHLKTYEVRTNDDGVFVAIDA